MARKGPARGQAARVQPRAIKIPGPLYFLQDVQPVARLAMIGKTVSGLVVDRLGVSEPEAERFIRNKIARLKPSAYVESVRMLCDDGSIDADVYGVRDSHGEWYVKFNVEHGRIIVWSCHEPKHQMKCEEECDGTSVVK